MNVFTYLPDKSVKYECKELHSARFESIVGFSLTPRFSTQHCLEVEERYQQPTVEPQYDELAMWKCFF